MVEDQILIQKFERLFLRTPEWISSAPGRVNLIGEHTDYNGGFVMPAAIDEGIKMAVAKGKNKAIHLYSENYNDSYSIDLSKPVIPPSKKSWSNYFMAVVHQFQKRGVQIPPLDIYLWGDIPVGSGLSSSAAYEVCVGTFLNYICETDITKLDLAQLTLAAEKSDFIGVQCGIMDQFISIFGESNKALKLDCYSLEYQLVPFDSSKAKIVIINTLKKRGLVDSEYNQRRSECDEGLNLIKKLSGGNYMTLRHVPMDIFNQFQEKLSINIRKRVKHNLTENQRVHHFSKALQENNFQKAGELLYESHSSLRDDFQVSCQELDRIVEIAETCKGVYGCRMTGAGFGGSAVALVKPEFVEDFLKTINQEYYQTFSINPEIYLTQPSNGAEVIPL